MNVAAVRKSKESEFSMSNNRAGAFYFAMDGFDERSNTRSVRSRKLETAVADFYELAGKS
jgi:hypothetical protein